MTKRVLVVEDDLLNRMLFGTWLKDHACEVEESTDGCDVCERAHTQRPDLIVMDIRLPKVSGVTLIEQLKADPALGGIPVLAITGYATTYDEDRIRSAGACDYLRKPVSHKDFTDAVGRLLLPEAASDLAE